MGIKDEVRGYKIFDDMAAEEMDAILRFGEEVFYKTDQVLFDEDQLKTDPSLLMIMDGMISVQLEADHDKLGLTANKRQAILTKGEVFGEIGFLGAEKRSAHVSAYSDVRLLKIDGAQLFELFVNNPRLGYIFMRNLATILSERVIGLNYMWRDEV